MAKNGALKVVSTRIELPAGRFAVRLGWRGCGSANSSVIWGEVLKKKKNVFMNRRFGCSTATDERRHKVVGN